MILLYTFESCYRQSEFHYISTWLQHSILLESRASFNLYLLEGINVTCILQCCHCVTSHMNFDVDHIALNPLWVCLENMVVARCSVIFFIFLFLSLPINNCIYGLKMWLGSYEITCWAISLFVINKSFFKSFIKLEIIKCCFVHCQQCCAHFMYVPYK